MSVILADRIGYEEEKKKRKKLKKKKERRRRTKKKVNKEAEGGGRKRRKNERKATWPSVFCSSASTHPYSSILFVHSFVEES